MELRDYQTDIVNRVRGHMAAGFKRILIQLPTGGGKTAIASHMMKAAAAKGHASWFNCNRVELIKQTMQALNKFDVYHGVISAGFMEDSRPLVQVCSVPSLRNRLHRLKRPKMIIWDECRFLGARTWEAIFRAYPEAYHIGLDATPCRLDGKGLNDFFEVMVMGPRVSWLIENNYLSPYKAFAPSRAELTGVHTSMGDYVKGELATAMDKPSITGNAIKEYRARADGKRNIIFCVSVEHSQHVVAQFKAAGISAAHVDGGTDSSTRDLAIKDFASGKIKVLSNCELFTFGFDVPSVECVTLLRPTSSLSMYLQMVGRGLRTSPGKSHCTFLDHANLFETHGLPDEDRTWSLVGSQSERRGKAEQKLSVKICPNCFAAQESGKTSCQNCGEEFEVKSRSIEHHDGDLKEITKEELEKRRAQKEAAKTQGRAQSLAELTELGRQRGMKNPAGWAKHVFNARQLKKIRGG